MKARPEKEVIGISTAGGRELRLKARPPARLALLSMLQEHTETKENERK